jgi:hypothetical protein
MKYEEAINTQYGRSDLGKKILALLESEELGTARLAQDALAPIEELHLRGRTATIELAKRVGLNESMRVLDVGCGIDDYHEMYVNYNDIKTSLQVIGYDFEEYEYPTINIGTTPNSEFPITPIRSLGSNFTLYANTTSEYQEGFIPTGDEDAVQCFIH